LPILITNCSNNYGPYQFPEKLIPVVILSCLAEKPIPVYGKGENIRDWLYVGDHARALLTVLDKGTNGETYNVGGNNERRNIDLVKTICTIMDSERPRSSGSYSDLITFVTDRPGHDRRYAVNASKIKNALNWKPSISADEGFEQSVKWYLNNRDWWQPLLSRSGVGKRLGLI
jgi:dTDP-glucose 4,6-dehydratase